MKEQNNAGFWLRAHAMWIDLLVVYTGLKLFYYLLLILPVTIYFPFEFTLLMALFVYSISLTYWKGQTLGKWLLNITIINSTNNKLSISKIILRETVLKLLSASVLFLGFFWIGFTRKKKAWHDSIVNSNVRKNGNPSIVNTIAKYIGIVLFILLFGNYLYGLYEVYNRSTAFALLKKVEYPFMMRNADDVIEISKLSPSNDTIFENWLVKNSKTPEDYVVEIATKYRVTLIGEEHEIKDNLNFFNKVISNLYHKSGVRCIALECLPRTMNRKIEKLINGETFDRSLAISISRSQPWALWGYKEYWDVLETVWKLNKSITDNSEKMRIIGIDEDWEGPYFAYFSPGDDKLGKVPIVEKMKLPFIIDDFAKMMLRDELMAYNIEKEIIKKNVKGVVWIGYDHTPVNFARPVVKNRKIKTTKPRMGVFLKQKYGNQIFQMVLYNNMKSSDTAYFNPFIERIMDNSSLNGVAFNLENSPFAMLRDDGSKLFKLYPTITFLDLYEGFIYLNPLKQLQKCTWTKDYISKDMYMKYKPFYCSKLKYDFSSTEQMNNLMSKK